MPRTIVLLIVQKIKTEVSNENLLISLRTVVLLVSSALYARILIATV
ncbi:unnamed protein product [Rotaria magnacalcarata]|uniref:Uncharacterized protein n=2 Tax=Rotaria magnacalcarata TaxID=392030 RepID=A0A8S3K8H0_9BILA|nr:unnamed protein product [Rotaria magnacalcarata]